MKTIDRAVTFSKNLSHSGSHYWQNNYKYPHILNYNEMKRKCISATFPEDKFDESEQLNAAQTDNIDLLHLLLLFSVSEPLFHFHVSEWAQPRVQHTLKGPALCCQLVIITITVGIALLCCMHRVYKHKVYSPQIAVKGCVQPVIEMMQHMHVYRPKTGCDILCLCLTGALFYDVIIFKADQIHCNYLKYR